MRRFLFWLASVSRTASGFALPRALTRANFRRVLQQISKAAVAGDADNINKQARKERTDWINKQKNKQAPRLSRESCRATPGL